MSDSVTEGEDIRANVGNCMQHLSSLLTPLAHFTWNDRDEDQYWEFLRRGAVTRQRESVLAVLSMVDESIGHFGVTLLRPAFEELIWIEYLQQHQSLANELVILIAKHEIAQSLTAQNSYLGRESMQGIGFTQRFVKTFLAREKGDAARLREIGRSLGWRDGKTSPSVAFIARQVKKEREYEFLYHATSRYAHFSPHEIFRRVWGKKGQVEISSSAFSKYWSDFAMYWSFRLLIETVSASRVLEGQESVWEKEPDGFLQSLRGLYPIQILTKEELESWNRAS